MEALQLAQLGGVLLGSTVFGWLGFLCSIGKKKTFFVGFQTNQN